jgi:adenylate cyclase
MSGDPEQGYFADGMVEEIITALSRFKWLFVIARNSSFTFKGKAVDVKEVGRRLGVRYVLEGSVRKASGKVRITGQLVDAVTGAHIWADRFERDLTDVFAFQDEVTVAVVSAIQPKLLQREIGMATRRRPENLTAYDLFLRAMQQHYLATREGVAETLRLANRAFELDPRFGLVAALAGNCHAQNVVFGYAADPQFERKEAVRLLRLALSIDDGDPDTIAMVAMISAYMVGDSESEIELADRAVALNPNSFRAWSCRGQVYRIAGMLFQATSPRNWASAAFLVLPKRVPLASLLASPSDSKYLATGLHGAVDGPSDPSRRFSRKMGKHAVEPVVPPAFPCSPAGVPVSSEYFPDGLRSEFGKKSLRHERSCLQAMSLEG